MLEKTHRADKNLKCIVDLNEVTFIDEKGERLLRTMSKEGAHSWPPVCTSSMCFNRDVEDEAVKEPNYVNQTHNNIEGEETVCRLCRRLFPEEDMTLVAARRTEVERPSRSWSNVTRKGFSWLRGVLPAGEKTPRCRAAKLSKKLSRISAKFEGRSAFSTWLTRIAITEALMFLRRNRGLREVFIDDLNGNEETTTPLEFPDSSPNPEAIYSHREQVEMLSSAINELPVRDTQSIPAA